MIQSNIEFATKGAVVVSGKLSLPSSAAGKIPLIVMMHGCSGIFSYSDPSKGLSLQFREWNKKITDAGYAVLLIDSFSGRGVAQNQCEYGASSNTGVSEVAERPYDAYAGVEYLRANYQDKIDFDRAALIGWSHGGSSVLSAMSTVVAEELGSQVFKRAFSFYPGCGLYGAFGGIADSVYKAYAPTTILAAGIDPLYTVGYCDCRVDRSVELGSSNLAMTVYPGSQHSFDLARSVGDEWTQADVDAKRSSNAYVMDTLKSIFTA